MEFNEQQKKIIENIHGAFLISAPVGTGKTTVLTERIMTALASGIRPDEILCLTFTNRAAEEMAERVKRRIEHRAVFEEILIKTFHGFCAYFCKAEHKALGIHADFVIFDQDEQTALFTHVLEQFPSIPHEHARDVQNSAERVYQVRLNELERAIGCQFPEAVLPAEFVAAAARYRERLYAQNALDFHELVLLTMDALYRDQSLKEKWSRKFKFIQVDEFQDTHVSEYLVVKQLARVHKNLSFIGDLDQTIYGWRGSEPLKIVQTFTQHFAPVQTLHLETNYRFDPDLLEGVKSFLASFGERHTTALQSNRPVRLRLGDESHSRPIEVFEGYSLSEEIAWVVRKITEIRGQAPAAKIAVLARANWLIAEVARIFTDKGVAHMTVDAYDFFRRQEVKDAYAYLRILGNPFDSDSVHRILQRPPRSIGDATLREIRERGSVLGLSLPDFLVFRNYSASEPFAPLLAAWESGRIVVLDTETTGTNPLKDEIIQVFAVEVVHGTIRNEFHAYLANTVSVGVSEAIHGISDAFLRDQGGDPRDTLAQLKEFIGASAVVGHNIMFDLDMIRTYGGRLGIAFTFPIFFDTLDISRRFVQAENYKLGTLAARFGLATATHSADDDVRATVGLLALLVEKLRPGHAARKVLWKEYAKKCITLASSIAQWYAASKEMRPGDLLEKILHESGLAEYYASDADAPRRNESLTTLRHLFRLQDNEDRAPFDSLAELLRSAALTRHIDFLGLEHGKIPVVTVHQVKGLEFEYIFLVGLNEYIFPILREGADVEEEKRLFYVALTRARERVFLSFSDFDRFDRAQTRSRFIGFLDPQYVAFAQ